MNLFDDVALLVDLDWVNQAVAALVIAILPCLCERGVQFFQPVFEDVAKSQQHGSVQIEPADSPDKFLQIDAALRVFGRVYREIATFINADVSLAPIADGIEILRLTDVPAFENINVHAHHPALKPSLTHCNWRTDLRCVDIFVNGEPRVQTDDRA